MNNFICIYICLFCSCFNTASSNYRGPTVHSMFGWSFDEMRDKHEGFSISPRNLSRLRAHYADTDVFVIDEIDAMPAAMLALLDETMRTVFEEQRKPFGGKKLICLGDPAQLKPVFGEPLYGKAVSVKPKGRRGSSLYAQKTKKGQEIYRTLLAPNCILFKKPKRNSGLLQMICDKLRDGTQDDTDLDKLTYQRTHFPDVKTDYGIHYQNEACCMSNWRQLWSDCKSAAPPKQMYVMKATYHTTDDNQPIVEGLTALPPKQFGFAADVLCVSVGCDVRLIRNINVAAGLVNSATGRVVAIIFNNADVPLVLDGKNPPAYCIIVDFPGFVGFLTKDDRRVFPFKDMPHWVPIYREQFKPMKSDIPSWISKKQNYWDCWRQQFPLDLCRHYTAHRAQGQTLGGCLVSVDLGLGCGGRLPSDISSLMYVACTRVRELRNLFVTPMSLKVRLRYYDKTLLFTDISQDTVKYSLSNSLLLIIAI